MRDLPFEEYTQSEVDEAVKAFKEGKPKKRIEIRYQGFKKTA